MSSTFSIFRLCLKDKLKSSTFVKCFSSSANLNYPLPNISIFSYNLEEEFKKFGHQIKENFNHSHFLIKDPRDTIDILFAFENDKDLNKFQVRTDSSYNMGYSSAALKLTESQTGLFYGNLCTEIPKTGDFYNSGFVNITSYRKMLAFGKPGFYDWNNYTHVILKLRGDGRTYFLRLMCPGPYDHQKFIAFTYPLYTRGGPYWQITRIPFAHFFMTDKGRIVESMSSTVPLNKIAKIGLTLNDNTDGPFKIEIDYIGLEKIGNCKNISPYETYFVGRSRA